MINEKDLRLKYLGDRGNWSLDKCITTLNEEKNNPHAEIVLDYLFLYGRNLRSIIE